MSASFLSDLLLEGASHQGDREALVFEDLRLPYAALNERVNRLADALGRLGLHPGDHVAILLENCHAYMEFYYALSKAGMVAVPLNWRLSEKELLHILDHSQSVALVAGAKHVALAQALRARLPRLAVGVSVECDADGMEPYEALVTSGCDTEPERGRLSPDAMAVLMYTGGTTGLPKGVMLSHRNLLAAIESILAGGIRMTGARTVFALPFFHIANWQAFLFHALGGCVVVSRTAIASEIVALLQRERPQLVNLVPTVYEAMLRIPGIESMDFSFVSRFNTAGAPMLRETMKRCEQVFRMRLGQGYGLTEAAPAVSGLSPDEYRLEGDATAVRRSHSVGRPLRNVEVVVRQPDGAACAPHESGEITVRGPNVMLGYWRDPERTREALRDGWLWTGDVGHMDEDGYLYLVDRKSDMILSGGENVYPTETENALLAHPAVRAVTVFGVPDAQWGEAVKAMVVREPGVDVGAEDLIAFCRTQIAGYKCPKSIDFVDDLPQSTVGKVLRNEVKRRYWPQPPRAGAGKP